jgi:large subunit ribosomal protein L13
MPGGQAYAARAAFFACESTICAVARLRIHTLAFLVRGAVDRATGDCALLRVVSAAPCGGKTLKTYSMKRDEIQKDWLVIDAEDVPLGRLATRVATFLRGKHKPTFTPHLDMGDNVIVINATKVKLTGQKMDQKVYRRYSGYIGGQKVMPAKFQFAKEPERLITHAVRGMMPKNRLGRRLMTHLRVYAGAEHPHTAQQPKTVDID